MRFNVKMNFYIDAGASWANTLRLANDLFPKRNWTTVAFEASPLIQPFVDEYAQFLNGERRDEPTVCLPRSGSTAHLRKYSNSLNCNSRSDRAMRACVAAALAPRLAALKPDPALNSSELVNNRTSEAAKGTPGRFFAVPAAVGARDGWVTLWGSPMQLIRGGAMLSGRAARSSSTHHYTTRQVDLASWIKKSVSVGDFLFLKLDVEGAEHAVLRRMEQLGVHRLVDALALECHDQRHECAATLRRVQSWNVTVIRESQYKGMDSATAGETAIDLLEDSVIFPCTTRGYKSVFG